MERITSRPAYSVQGGVATASAYCLFFRGDTTGAGRKIGLQGQMSCVLSTGARMDVDLPRRKRIATFRAHHHRIEILPADTVSVQHRPPFLLSHIDIAPVDDSHHYREEVEPFLRQAVFITQRALLVRHLDEHELVDELLE